MMQRIWNRPRQLNVTPTMARSTIEPGSRRTKNLRIKEPALNAAADFSKGVPPSEFDRRMMVAGDIHLCNGTSTVRLHEFLDQFLAQEIASAPFFPSIKTTVKSDLLQVFGPT